MVAFRTKWHFGPCSRLATIDVDRKLGVPPLFGEGAGVRIKHKVAWAEGYLHIKWHVDPCIWQHIWAENWGLCPVGGGGAESPSNTMWPEPRPTCVPCFILNRPTVGHRAPTSQTDRINRTDRQTERRTGQRSDGRGRTVLQTVAQKR